VSCVHGDISLCQLQFANSSPSLYCIFFASIFLPFGPSRIYIMIIQDKRVDLVIMGVREHALATVRSTLRFNFSLTASIRR
jgi:hypothetical protein